MSELRHEIESTDVRGVSTRRFRPGLALLRLLWLALVGLSLAVLIAGILATFPKSVPRTPGAIGAEIGWNEVGESTLWPWRDYPAFEAGIRRGDVLVAIDGLPVPAKQAPMRTQDLLGGTVGTSVTVTTRNDSGMLTQSTLTREPERMYRAAARLKLPPAFAAFYFPIVELLLSLAFVATGLFLAARRFDSWYLLFVSCALILQAPAFTFFHWPLVNTHPEWSWVVSLNLTLATAFALLFIYLAPDGRLVPRWAALLAIGWVAWIVADNYSESFFLHAQPSWVGSLAYLGWYVTGIVSQAYRYRYVSSRMQRQQTKLVVLGLSIAVAGYYGWELALHNMAAADGVGLDRFFFWVIGRALYVLALVCVPSAIAVAAMRYRLWDIDLVINRALVYGLLTASLATIYFGGVAALQAVSRDLIVHASELGLVVSTLIIFGLAGPLRSFFQTAIDRRFYRRKYDAERTITVFSRTLSQEGDLGRVSENFVDVVNETMQPARVSLWLKTDR